MASGRPWLLLALALALPLAAARGPWTRASTSCHMAATGSRARFRSFLWRRPDGAPPVLLQGAWDARGHLLGCAWRAEPALTASYRQSCAQLPVPGGGPLERAFWGPALRRDLEVLAEQKDSCWGAQRPGPSGGGRAKRAAAPAAGAGRRKRVRRGWTMPGTLWCGAGDSAGNFSELGVFQGPDVCCREHDQCEAQIAALGYKYGMRNYRFHTISHCDCDARFRQCLMSLNDTISNFIGISFFNLLEVPCFVLEESEECVEWHWWGGCKRYGPMPLAHLVEQNHYQPVLPFTENSDMAASPPPRPGRHRGKGRKRGRKNHRKRPGQEAAERQRLDQEQDRGQDLISPQIPVSRLDLNRSSQAPTSPRTISATRGTMALLPAFGATAEPGLLKTGATPSVEHLGTQPAHLNETRQPSVVMQTEKPFWVTSRHRYTTVPGSPAPSQSCNCYRRLDQCPYRIAPNEVKYHLHNLDFRTLFHCNCTRRLARFLRKTKGPNEVEEEVLSDYVSSSCFLFQAPPGCMAGEKEHLNCIDVGRAILAPARHLTNRLTRKQPGASFKVKRQERTPPGRPVQLYEKCMQLAKAPHPTMPR
ncbi:group 3 secretory phospholipase A2 [Eublepharis macularius]|uniref:phospholipase A2 n=1 Tax=Eublepharis macularius TaxID=481883 RepID=A0AA97KDC6_EUBMA|nr:group 3 secretory phospholipase A2 [Eublepharis macularius]